MSTGVVIIGAGHAGGLCAGFLRQYGFEGPITLIGAESHPPYQRPPLSKAWLKGDASGDDLFLRADRFYADNTISLRLGATVAAIERASRRVLLTTGEEIGYDHLVLATGSAARALPSSQVSYHVLRGIDDAEALKAELRPGARLGLIGAGYVGLEVAASARALGCDVTVLERAPRILARVASSALSEAFTALHGTRGVNIRTGIEIASAEDVGPVRRVTSASGEVWEFDALVVGIGALPAEELALSAGLECHNGVVVDETAATSDPHIYAIGDVASRTLPFYPGRFRLESVPNAIEQAKQAAAAITGAKPPMVEAPWFWSDQYDAKLQIAGLLIGETRTVRRAEAGGDGAFSLFHLSPESRVICAECVNRPADFMAARQLIAKAVMVEDHVIADSAAPLKSYLSR